MRCHAEVLDKPSIWTDLTLILLRKNFVMPAAEKLTTIVSTKGQVILPKAIRDRRHWESGTKLVVEETDDGVLLRPVPLFKATSIAEVAGMLAYQGKAQSIEDMDDAVMREAERRAGH